MTPPPVKRLYGVTNTYSGVVGEMAVATALIRAGHQVAKPYWNDDEMDLLVFWWDEPDFIPIPIQVKSLQRAGSDKEEIATQGLKKKYVEGQPALCLAIYSPELNKIWFIPGADKIREVHQFGVEASRLRGNPRDAYETIDLENDVRIYVNLTKQGDAAFDGKWLIDVESPMKINQTIRTLARRCKEQHQTRLMMQEMFTSAGMGD